MIRPATFVAMLAFIFAGLFLYQIKHRSQMLDREIAQVLKETEETRAHATLLRTDYQMLSAPGRLEELAQSLLKLRPTAPTQYTSLADLGRRLPPVGPLPDATPPEPEAPPAAAPVAAAPQPAAPPAPTPTAAKPEAKPDAKPDTAAARPVAVAALRPPPRTAPASAQAAGTAPAARPAPRPASLAAAPRAPEHLAERPAITQVAARAEIAAPPTSSAEAIRQIVRGGRVDPAVPAVASALGMARTMTGAPDMAAQAATLHSASTHP